MQLQKGQEKLEAAGVHVVGISYDSVEILKKFGEAQTIKFPLLSDPKSKTIDAYRLRNKRVRAGSRQDGVPYPATFVIDREGIVRAKLPGTTRKRHTTAELLEAVGKMKSKS